MLILSIYASDVASGSGHMSNRSDSASYLSVVFIVDLITEHTYQIVHPSNLSVRSIGSKIMGIRICTF